MADDEEMKEEELEEEEEDEEEEDEDGPDDAVLNELVKLEQKLEARPGSYEIHSQVRTNAFEANKAQF